MSEILKKETERLWKIPIVAITVILVASGISILMAYPLMWCWNYVVPIMFGLPEMTFWQMFCLNVLMTSFFKNTSTK